MSKKQLIVVCLIMMIFGGLSFAEQEQLDPFSNNKSSVYEYKDKDIPDICFFPIDKARWDGSKITPKEWQMLTDFQKSMFIAEYVGQLEKEHNTTIEINGWDYLIYLNTFAEKPEVVDTPMTMAIESLLSKEGEFKNE